MHVGQALGCNWGLWDVYLSCRRGQSIFYQLGDVWVFLIKSVVALFREGLHCSCLGVCHCSSIGQQSKTIADGIGKVYLIYWRSMWEGQSQQKPDCGVKDAVFEWYSMKRCVAFARIGSDNNILQFGVYCMSGSCPLDVILLLLGWSNPSVAWERGSYAMIWTM